MSETQRATSVCTEIKLKPTAAELAVDNKPHAVMRNSTSSFTSFISRRNTCTTTLRSIISLFSNPQICINRDNAAREYHYSSSVWAKPKKGKSTPALESSDDEEEIKLPDINDYEKLMDKRVVRLTDELSKLRGGKVSNDMFDHVLVEAYGSRVPVPETGQVTIKTPTKVSIAVFDPVVIQAVAKALTDCGMNLNPVVDGNMVEIIIPKPSKEAREGLIKTAAKAAEKSKTEVRQLRKQSMDDLKYLKGSISEDDTRRLTKEFEALTEKKINKIIQLFSEKEKELMKA
eukprot:gene6780-13734_t